MSVCVRERESVSVCGVSQLVCVCVCFRGRKPGSGRKNGGPGAKGKDKKLSGTESEQEVNERCSPCETLSHNAVHLYLLTKLATSPRRFKNPPATLQCC